MTITTSADMIEAALRAKIARLEVELQSAWPTQAVAIFAALMLILGVLIGASAW